MSEEQSRRKGQTGEQGQPTLELGQVSGRGAIGADLTHEQDHSGRCEEQTVEG